MEITQVFEGSGAFLGEDLWECRGFTNLSFVTGLDEDVEDIDRIRSAFEDEFERVSSSLFKAFEVGDEVGIPPGTFRRLIPGSQYLFPEAKRRASLFVPLSRHPSVASVILKASDRTSIIEY